ncbi:MAG: OmpH family outer membrane protein [Desulfovibrionaceae bacterium]
MRLFLKNTIMLSSFLLLSFSFQLPATAATIKGKVAAINVQNIVSQSNMGKDAAKKLEDEFGVEKKRLEADIAEFQKKESEFQKKVSALSSSAKEKQTNELLQQRRSIETRSTELSRRLQTSEAKLREDLLKSILEASQAVGKKESVSMIIDGNQAGILYVEQELDLTEAVLKVMDASYKK